MGEDRTARPGATNQRVTVPEAAELLGITVEAARMRIKRGTLRSERRAGRVFVLLGSGRPTERTEPTEDRTAELIATLREQLRAERQAHAEARRIIAGLVERIPPAIEAPREAREAPETAEEEAERVRARSDAPSPHSEAQATRRPWWRRIFGP